MEFRDLIDSSQMKAAGNATEARFSFLHGGYVEDLDVQGNKSFGLMGVKMCFNFIGSL